MAGAKGLGRREGRGHAMTDELSFGEPEYLIGTLLPYNYFPGAFGALTKAPDAMNRIVLVLPGADEGRRAGLDYHVVSQETLNENGDPASLSKYLSDRGINDDFAFRRCFLGPPTRLDETAVGQARRLEFEPFEIANAEAVTQVALIIDIGIAFWNTAFRSKTGPRFKAMRYLDFDAFSQPTLPPGIKPPLAPLPDYEIARLCDLSDQPGGHDMVVAELGRSFPDSYFGRYGAAEPGTMWHGTAMADLMAGQPKDAPDTTVLMGIELPMKVLRDADGDSLGAVLTMLVEGALEMTIAFSGVPLLIALPWGFTGGPQDGSHPFAVAIDQALALHPNRDVKLLLPMGNQMQDRCCAHLLPSDVGETEDSVVWRVPPDDFSENTAEFQVLTANPVLRQTVRITAPTGQTAVVLLRESRRVWIRRNGVIIGGIVRNKDAATGPRLRMTLAPTGWRPDTALPCFAGDWTLSFHHEDEVRVWVLRDDRDWSLDKALPRRASYLFDQTYKERDEHDAYHLTNDKNSAVVRSGTASLLATARTVIAVQADETLGAGKPQPAWYSGNRVSLKAAEARATVDIGRHEAGILAAANGTAQKVKVTGTSAAIALAARGVLGLPARPA